MKVHAGADAGSGYVHTITGTAANEHDSQQISSLIRRDDEVVYGDSWYLGAEGQERIKTDGNLSKIEFRINKRPSSQHELVHAWQEYNRDREEDPEDTCARVVQEELAAYRESCECQRKVRMGISPSVRACMIEGAIASSYPSFCETTEEARREIDKLIGTVNPSIYPNLP